MLLGSPNAGGTLAHHFIHFLDGYGSPPGFDHSSQGRGREFRKDDHTAIWMHEEFDTIAGLQSQMVTNRLRDGGLPLDCDCGLHIFNPLHFIICNTSPLPQHPATTLWVNPARQPNAKRNWQARKAKSEQRKT